MIEINGTEKEMIKIEKKNIVYINSGKGTTNLYERIKCCSFCNVFFRCDIDNLTLESYDAYIISIAIFNLDEGKVKKLLDEIYSFNKPVIIIYDSGYLVDFKGLTYLKNRFNITFEKKDASIIEDSYEGYLPNTRDDYALAMVSSSGYGKAYIKNTKSCFVLRFDNITIIHDSKLEFIEQKREIVKPLQTLLLNLLQLPQHIEKPEWIDEIKILNEIEIENEINILNEKIRKLLDEKEKSEKKLELNNEYKKILYTSGDELVNVVKKMLSEILGINIGDLDVKKEDLSFDLDGKKVLVEIKGVNTPIKREYVSQIQRHLEDEARKNNIDDDDISANYKGLLIVNPYIKTPVKERIKKEFYSDTVKGDIKHHDICTLDTITFLTLFEKFIKSKNIDLKTIILNSNYNEPDFSILE